MAYGQYSAGSCRRTKAEMLEHFAADHDIVASKRAGHNRLDFTTRNGARHFALHLTVVASLSADGTRLTIADGGWPTPTTRSAWGDALGAFDLTWAPVTVESEWHDGGTFTYGRSDWPAKTERSVVYVVEAGVITGRAASTPDLPMIRASVDHGEGGNFAVRFDAAARKIVSEAGVTIPCTPFRALVELYRVDALARATRGYFAMRGCALDSFGFTAFGYHITPGQSSSIIMIGCHSFKTREIRATLAQIAGQWPAAAKKARAFVKANPTDFGVAAHEAAMRARYARAA